MNPKIHFLKIEQKYLDDLLSGDKKSEIRYNDRDYQVRDILQLRVVGTDRSYPFRITHIHSGLGMNKDYVALSIERISL